MSRTVHKKVTYVGWQCDHSSSYRFFSRWKRVSGFFFLSTRYCYSRDTLKGLFFKRTWAKSNLYGIWSAKGSVRDIKKSTKLPSVSELNERSFMRRSIRNFNIPPPGHTAGIWLCIMPGEGGIWTLRWKGGEFEPDLSLVLTQYAREFFRFLLGLTDLQDRISPLWVNNSFKRVLKEAWRCHYGISLSERRVKCLIEDGIFLWGEVVQY